MAQDLIIAALESGLPLLKRPVSVMFAFSFYFISTNRSAAGSNFSDFFFLLLKYAW